MSETISTLLRDLADDDRSVRQAAENRLIELGVQAVDSVLPYVGDDGSPRLKWGSESVLQRLDDQAVPRLREIRRQGPGRLRSNALRVLVDLGGAENLDEGDRSAVERLVRIKLKDELPVTLPSEAGRWLAFPADRLDDAVAALALHDLRPVTTVMGVAAATKSTDSLEFQDTQGATHRAYRVFITPEFENAYAEGDIKRWRMLWGNSFLDELDGFELAGKLSVRCGEAHFYVLDPYDASENCWLATTHPDVPNSRFKGALPV
jgi:hypothetical protein